MNRSVVVEGRICEILVRASAEEHRVVLLLDVHRAWRRGNASPIEDWRAMLAIGSNFARFVCPEGLASRGLRVGQRVCVVLAEGRGDAPVTGIEILRESPERVRTPTPIARGWFGGIRPQVRRKSTAG
jgi:hypothetical protein